jgi:capsular polysaccharide biosynthesis protein
VIVMRQQPTIRPVSLAEHFGGRDGLVIRWPASKYTRREAVLVNPEMAEPRISNLFRRLGGATPCGGVATFANATIFGGGTIGVADGVYVAESVDISMVRSRNSPGEEYLNERTGLEFERAVFAGRQAQTQNYAHFLVEVLPRLLLCRDALPDDVPLLIHESGDLDVPSMLRVTGVDANRLRWITRHPVQVETLYWPTPNTLHPLHHSPPIFPCLRALAELQHCAPAHRRLFVSRASADRRRLLNEDEVFDQLAPWGFERVLPGEMSFEEQISLFAEASLVVAICGAGLTNMVFMPPGGTVIMISPSSVPGVFFWDIAHHRDVKLIAMWGRNDDPSDHGQHADFWMNPRVLRDVVGRAAG